MKAKAQVRITVEVNIDWLDGDKTITDFHRRAASDANGQVWRACSGFARIVKDPEVVTIITAPVDVPLEETP